ncbi:TIGR00282 family metallophosphoesterase [bacterium]|nr:MAG: TIGR00282 family metallophosphoesterase [bacterium]
MNVLFLGDIVGRPGREAVKKILPGLKGKFEIDVVVANGENLAHGIGITQRSIDEIKDYGVDLLTSGNHIWKRKQALEIVEEDDPFIIRPANYPQGVPGKGWKLIDVAGEKLIVVNLEGRVFMDERLDCPFRALDQILDETKKLKADAIVVDFHAEATSEKKAMGFYAKGRVSAVLGTHTHVQTADEIVFPDGTAYISDVGMVGGKNSILGVKVEQSLSNFLYQIRPKFEVAEGEMEVCGVVLEIQKGKTISIKRIREIV